MPTFCFKVYYPQLSESRYLRQTIEKSIYGFGLPQYRRQQLSEQLSELKKSIRKLYGISDDVKFHLTLKDNANDDIAIRSNQDLEHMLFVYQTYNHDLKLTIITEENPAAPTATTAEAVVDDSASIISESLQSIMKHLEQGISTLQASVEKNTTNTVDAVVKTAVETAAHVYRSMLPPPTLSEKPQFDVICDGCYTPIRGQRWRCETCDDFDLCSTCKSRVNHNQQHNFRFIKNKSLPTQQEQTVVDVTEKAESCNSEHSQTIFVCDYCDSEIVGIRHTCGACPDFDLCHSCFAIVKENHPDHIFVTRLVGTQATSKCKKANNKGKKSANTNTPTKSATTTTTTATATTVVSPRPSHDDTPVILHRGVECDNCDAEVTGIRYKCGHCPNYDLCEICEEYAPTIHDKTHVFIKVRYPIQSLTQTPVLPKFSPLTEVKNSVVVDKQRPREMEMIHASNANNSSISLNILHSEKPTQTSSPSSSSLSIINAPSTPPVVVDTKKVQYTPEINGEGELSARFVSDLNIPDGTLVVPNKSFIKMWKIVNNGNVDWPVGTHLLFNGGSILRPYPVTKPNTFVVPVTSPREEACISAELQAPDCPGEYSSYFCLCTPDGVRFGDSLWCTIKVDFDEEPDNRSVNTSSDNKSTITAADIMMNSSNNMIYPTISTAASSLIHADEQEQHQQQYNDEEPQTPSQDGYTDQDDYSEFTSDHVSTLTSEAAHTYTDSHVSSPASSEIDIGERYRDMFSTEEEVEEEENNNHVEDTVNQTYQVISPSASTTLPTLDSNVTRVVEVAEEEEEGFVMIEEQQEDDILVQEELVSNESSLHSSVQTITTISNNNNNSTQQDTHHDDFMYQSQLLQLHEMGFTTYDDLAISLLNLHQGRIEDVIAKLLHYP